MRRIGRKFLCAVTVLLVVDAKVAESGQRPLSVPDVIESTRIQGGAVDGTPIVVSPGGCRYATALISGDMARNIVRMRLVSGSLKSPDAASRVETVASLSSSLRGSPVDPSRTRITVPGANPLRWLDEERLAFLWEDQGGIRQVYLADVITRKLEALTRHPTAVDVFAIHGNGSLLYTALLEHDEALSTRKAREGFAVMSPDAVSLIQGRLDDKGLLESAWANEWFLKRPGEPPRKLVLNEHGRNLSASYIAEFSPDGRYAVVDGTPFAVPQSWERYEDDLLQRQIRDWRLNGPEAFLARQLKQLFLIDFVRGTSRPLLDSPNPVSELSNVRWSANGKSIVVGPTFAPSPGDSLRADVFLTIDIQNGRMESLARPPPQQMPSRCDSRVRIEVREDRTQAPVLHAVEESGREKLILDPNLGLQETFLLGKVDSVNWTDATGRMWSALLYCPTNYSSDRRYPMVIQTHGHEAATRFSLHGVAGSGGLGPGMSLYAAQPLANRGIAVLQMQDRKTPRGDYEPQMYQEGYEAAARFFTSRGLADGARIGLSGFSRTGWHVEYALTHSAYPFAAAIASDNIDASYLQATLFPGYFLDEIGASPYGEGLKLWLEHAPGFNVEHLQTPLRLQLESHGLASAITQWEIFSRARQLKRPVELYVAPDIEHGSHHLQNPRQLDAIQQGAVDWYDFWLNKYESPDPSKKEQYARWLRMAKG